MCFPSNSTTCFSTARRAFTLIELLIVVAIIAILAAIAVPNFMEAQMRAKVARAKNDQRILATAMESYFVDWNDYPENSDESILSYGSQKFGGLIRLTTPVAFISSIPFDPFIAEASGSARIGPLTYEMASTGCRPLQPKGWAIASSGPDRNDDFGPGIPRYPNENLTVTLYDSTNGTKSDGDIVRFGPRMFTEKIRFK